MTTKIVCAGILGLLSCAALAQESNFFPESGLITADTRGQDRRDNRGDNRDDRQDCRQEEGVAGSDKRNCKQDSRGKSEEES